MSESINQQIANIQNEIIRLTLRGDTQRIPELDRQLTALKSRAANDSTLVQIWWYGDPDDTRQYCTVAEANQMIERNPDAEFCVAFSDGDYTIMQYPDRLKLSDES